MSDISILLTHTASVETFTSRTTYAPPVIIKGRSSGSSFYAALSDASRFTRGSRVTIDGKMSWVATTYRWRRNPPGLPGHIEVELLSS